MHTDRKYVNTTFGYTKYLIQMVISNIVFIKVSSAYMWVITLQNVKHDGIESLALH